MAFSVRGAFNHSAEIADSGRFANLVRVCCLTLMCCWLR